MNQDATMQRHVTDGRAGVMHPFAKPRQPWETRQRGHRRKNLEARAELAKAPAASLP